MSGDVNKSIPWNFFLLVEEDFEHSKRCIEIGIIEFVLDIPAERTELSSLLDDGVEERDSKDELAPNFGFLAVIEELVCVVGKSSLHVCLNTSWWLGCHLHTVLQDRDGEEIGWHRGEEKSEVFMDLLAFFEELQYLLF